MKLPNKKGKPSISKIQFNSLKKEKLIAESSEIQMSLSWDNDDCSPSTDMMILEYTVYFFKAEMDYPEHFSTFEKFNINSHLFHKKSNLFPPGIEDNDNEYHNEIIQKEKWNLKTYFYSCSSAYSSKSSVNFFLLGDQFTKAVTINSKDDMISFTT